MKTDERTADLPPDLAVDTQLVIDHLMTGKPLEPAAARRIRERGERIRENVLRTHGVLDIGAPAIREARDE